MRAKAATDWSTMSYLCLDKVVGVDASDPKKTTASVELPNGKLDSGTERGRRIDRY
jgi:hypothetical protein